MLNLMVKSMAQFFYKNQIIAEDDIEVYEYGLELLITSLCETIAVLLISILIGRFFITLLFILSFCSLRTFAGGYHANTNAGCFLTLLAVYAAFLCIVFLVDSGSYKALSLSFTVFSEIVIILMAPIDSENKPLSGEEKKRFRRISVLIVTVESILVLIFSAIRAPFANDVMLGISFGQLTAAGSLIAVKIINLRSKDYESIKNGNG